MSRKRISFKQELPLLIWLVLVWAALWRDFSPGNLIFGALIALIITRLFYLPPVELSGRFNPIYFLEYIGVFLWHVVIASAQVAYFAVVRGPRITNAVVAVRLRSHSDLMVTATGHVISLIPGSLVIEVDRSTSTLYLHVLNASTPAEVEKVRREVRSAEAWLIRVMGSKAELAALRAETADRPARQARSSQ
ncbi:Na+/H+ antiporter subunit E [Psychromicrobium lacuslunae]|uniref:Cation:proton antiporter n=1 Tax=Psychromicrobium lacuslunae TaxID=1618207 RepID=A0A0D4C0W9_9MICC|nr:Na+/H+ antiporter subunit E [Psychromicrobium lacuslunae]AJT42035.1 cation:proton antiporter [Psychromicrobium lacuslunae]